MDYKLEDLIDIKLLQSLQEKLNLVYSFPSAIIDNEGRVLTAVAWQDICTKFHRKNPECEKECIKSDLYISEHLSEANPAVSYQCPHGMTDNATPIIIEGKHLGNFFTGQFFLEEPDLEFFKKRAKKYGFDEKAYMAAVEKVPIWSKEKLTLYLDFIKGFIEIIAGIGQNHLKEIEANKKIKESEERNTAFIQSTYDWIWEIDEQGKYCYCSDRVENILGYTVEEIIGKTPFDFMLKEERERVNAIFQKLRDTQSRIVDLENYNSHKDGHLVCILTNGAPIIDETGILIGYRGADKDITERKQVEEELIKAKERAEESDRLKSAFLANMSHEIRTPMNGILGFAELLKEPGLTGEQQNDYIKIIEKSGARMLNIINDIVDISKIESGQMKVLVSETNVNDQIDFLYKFFKTEAEKKGLRLISKTALLPKDSIVLTDREKLYAILTNLIKNALKYTDKGGIEFGYNLVEPHSPVQKHGRASVLQFYVKDTGIGIPANKQKAIFERFIQADIQDIQARQGAGLGLSIAKAFVEMLGGGIQVESEVGVGSTFYFTLPNQTASSKLVLDESNGLNPNPGIAISPFILRLKILIAEDDETSERFLSILTKDISREVLKATTGLKAIEISRNNPDIDLILMDINMPEMGGYEATRQIRQFNKEGIIIAQTAYGLVGDREKSIQAGCNDHISKPIKSEEFKALIMKYFNK